MQFFGQFVCYFSVTVINVYWNMDADVWLVTAVRLYI